MPALLFCRHFANMFAYHFGMTAIVFDGIKLRAAKNFSNKIRKLVDNALTTYS